MALIFDGMFALSLLLALFWGLSVRRSLTRDRAEAEDARRQAEREAQESRRQAQRDARLKRKGEPLRCLGCEKTFPGPLGPDGCPRCRLTSWSCPCPSVTERTPAMKTPHVPPDRPRPRSPAARAPWAYWACSCSARFCF